MPVPSLQLGHKMPPLAAEKEEKEESVHPQLVHFCKDGATPDNVNILSSNQKIICGLKGCSDKRSRIMFASP